MVFALTQSKRPRMPLSRNILSLRASGSKRDWKMTPRVTPARSHASIIASHSLAVRAIGFSHSTCLPARVTAQTRTLNHAIEVEDGALALLEYPDQRLGLIQATTAAFPGFAERLEFYGARGSAIYHKGAGKLEWHLVEPREDRVEEAGASSGASAPMDISAAGHIAQYQDFVAALRGARAPLVNGAEGRTSVELVQAIYRSAQSRAPVDLPL